MNQKHTNSVSTNFKVEAIPQSQMVPEGTHGEFLCEIRTMSEEAPGRGEILITDNISYLGMSYQVGFIQKFCKVDSKHEKRLE